MSNTDQESFFNLTFAILFAFVCTVILCLSCYLIHYWRKKATDVRILACVVAFVVGLAFEIIGSFELVFRIWYPPVVLLFNSMYFVSRLIPVPGLMFFSVYTMVSIVFEGESLFKKWMNIFMIAGFCSAFCLNAMYNFANASRFFFEENRFQAELLAIIASNLRYCALIIEVICAMIALAGFCVAMFERNRIRNDPTAQSTSSPTKSSFFNLLVVFSSSCLVALLHIGLSVIDIAIAPWRLYLFADRFIMVVLYVPMFTILVSLAYKTYTLIHGSNDSGTAPLEPEKVQEETDEFDEEEREMTDKPTIINLLRERHAIGSFGLHDDEEQQKHKRKLSLGLHKFLTPPLLLHEVEKDDSSDEPSIERQEK